MKFLNTCAILLLALLSANCATQNREAVALYSKEGNLALSVDKNDLKQAANNVTYRLREDVWARVGDGVLRLTEVTAKLYIQDLLESKDSYQGSYPPKTSTYYTYGNK